MKHVLAVLLLTALAPSAFAGAEDEVTYKTSVQDSMEACVSACRGTELCTGVSFLQPDSRLPVGECKMTITPPPKPEPWDLATAESDLNAYRAQYGLRPVTLNPILTQASQAHSDDMAEMENADHKGSDGFYHDTRIKERGYNFSATAENVASGQFSWEAVFKAWQDSPGHNKNLLAANMTEVGIALTYKPRTKYLTYWTMVLATPVGR